MLKLITHNHNSNVKSSNVKIRAYNFSLSIIKFINSLPNKKMYWIVSDQLLRSSTSIGANIVEAKSSSSKKEFIKYYDISLKSANETLYWLSLLKDSKLIQKKEAEPLLDECQQITKMLASSLLTLKGKK